MPLNINGSERYAVVNPTRSTLLGQSLDTDGTDETNQKTSQRR